jgi:hypothetical protein
MTFASDSPVAARVVPSPATETGARTAADIKAIAIHMAEGGGTVSWLTRDDGNSSHYVVEYSGAVTQMVPETRWAGSINPRQIRLTNDPAFTAFGESVVYGRSAVLAAIGQVAANDPNRYVIAFEIEGFAAAGPNAAQRTALAKLVADIRSRRGPLPTLGHRDFQEYKACPGHKIPWVDYGGHGRVAQEDTVPLMLAKGSHYAGAAKPKPGLPILSGRGGKVIYTTKAGDQFPVVGDDTGAGDYYVLRMPGDVAGYLGHGGIEEFVVTPVPVAAAPDCATQVADAITADRAKARVVWS